MKKFWAILLAVCMLVGMFTFATIAVDALAVEKVEITDVNTFTVYFNKEVNPINDEGTDSAWAAWYLADAEGVVDESVRNGLDFGGVSEDKKSITYIATGVDLTEKAAEAEAAGKQIAFAFDVIGGGAPPVRTVDGTETLAGNTTLTSYGSAYVVTGIQVVYEPDVGDALAVEKVEITDVSTFTVYFNKEVNPINDEGTDAAWAGWYLADSEGVVDESVRNGLDFGGVSEDKKSITYIATGVDLAGKAAEAEAAGKQIAFAFDVIGGGAPPVRTVDGTETLAGNTTLTNYGSAYVVTGIQVVYELKSGDFTIEEAAFISQTTILVDFGESVEFTEQPWGAFYFRNKETGSLEGGRIGMSYRQMASTGTGAYYVSGSPDAPDGKAWEAYTRTGDYAAYTRDKYDLVFAFDNLGAQGNGIVKNADGESLAPNAISPSYANGLVHACDNVIRIDGYVEPSFIITEGFRVVSATAINEKQIVVEFSEPVHMIPPYAYIALRYTDNFGYLAMDNGTPLQFNGTSVMSGDGMRLTWTIDETGNPAGCNSVLDAIQFNGKLAEYSDYIPMMCVEEIDSIDDNDTVANVLNDANEELKANRVYSRAQGGADAAYVPVVENTAWEDPGLLPLEIPAMPEGLHIVKAVAVNDTQIVVEFSEPITFLPPYGFLAIRYVDRDFNLGFDGETPLQFYGAAVVSRDRKSVVWTLANEGNIEGADSLAAILDRTGALTKYKNYYPVFCLEEITEDGKGDSDALIENVVNDAGEKVVANCPSDTGYDRVYVNIEVDNVYAIPATGDINIAFIIAGMAIPVVLSAGIVVKKKKTLA